MRHFCWAWLLWRHSCILMQLGICLPQLTGVNGTQHMWGGLQLKRWHLLHPARINLLCPQKCSLGCYSETFDFRMKFIFQWKTSHFSMCWKERRWPEQPSRFWTITLLYHIIWNIPRALSSITQSWPPALHNYYICQRGCVTASIYRSVGEQNNFKSYKRILMKFSGNCQWSQLLLLLLRRPPVYTLDRRCKSQNGEKWGVWQSSVLFESFSLT